MSTRARSKLYKLAAPFHGRCRQPSHADAPACTCRIPMASRTKPGEGDAAMPDVSPLPNAIAEAVMRVSEFSERSGHSGLRPCVTIHCASVRCWMVANPARWKYASSSCGVDVRLRCGRVWRDESRDAVRRKSSHHWTAGSRCRRACGRPAAARGNLRRRIRSVCLQNRAFPEPATEPGVVRMGEWGGTVRASSSGGGS